MISDYGYIKDLTSTGDWFLDESGQLTLSEKWVEEEIKMFKSKFHSYTGASKYKFESFNSTFFKMIYEEGVSCCPEANTLPRHITQANKIK